MSTNITWKVESIECLAEKDGKQNVVFMVHWRCIGADGGYEDSSYGTQAITYEAGAPFTPYDELTEEEVIGWVKAFWGDERVSQIEARVIAQIEDQKSPPSFVAPLPWAL